MDKKKIKQLAINELRRVATLLSVAAIVGGLYLIFGVSNQPEQLAIILPEATPTESQVEAATTEAPEADQTPVATLTPIPPAGNTEAVGTVNNPEAIDVVVSKLQALPASYIPASLVTADVVSSNQGLVMRTEAAAAAESMFSDATAAELPLQLVSAYRNYDTQAEIFSSYAAIYGETEANRFSARAGQSEHQTGLAIDVSGTDGLCSLETCFSSTPTGQWVAANSAKYGFIIRYPAGAEGITGYSFEPWHLRYVGVELAQAISNSRLTMEQYLQ